MSSPTFQDILNKVLADKAAQPTLPTPVKVKKIKPPAPLTNIDQVQPIDSDNQNCCVCGRESKIGAHGIRDGKVFSEYYCAKDFNARATTAIKDVEDDDDEQVAST